MVRRARCHMVRASTRGRKLFHVRCMSWSYRNRGKEARTQRKVVDIIAVLAAKLKVVAMGIKGM